MPARAALAVLGCAGLCWAVLGWAGVGWAGLEWAGARVINNTSGRMKDSAGWRGAAACCLPELAEC